MEHTITKSEADTSEHLQENELEQYLQEKIFGDLEKGRPNDKQHTLLVVDEIKKIIEKSPNLQLDRDVLLIAAYAHDWGYTGLLDPNITIKLDHIKALKDTHMAIGAKKLEKLLEDDVFSYLTPSQKERAIHLVGIHDKLESLHDPDEIILMEADSLAGMNPDVMGVFGDSDSEERFMRKSRNLRLSKFITDYSKNKFEILFEKRKKVFEANQSILKHQNT